VSVLETGGDKITAFRTYFDTRHIPTARSQGGQGSGRVQVSGQKGGDAAPTDGGGSDGVSKDQMVEAQRDAADQRAGGGYS
jgi:hypothetical protein